MFVVMGTRANSGSLVSVEDLGVSMSSYDPALYSQVCILWKPVTGVKLGDMQAKS